MDRRRDAHRGIRDGLGRIPLWAGQRIRSGGLENAVGEAIIALDREIAEFASLLFNDTGRRSRSLPDCIIAATAILYSAKLATLNRADFEPFVAHGLKLA